MMGLFDNRFKFPVHMVQLALAVGVLIVAIVRMMNMPSGVPTGRSGTMALGMAAKSIGIMLYQILTEHVASLKKWSSLKAYFILNAMEIVFWAAVVFMAIQSNSRFCQGLSCTLNWIIVVLGIIVAILAGYMTVVTWFDWRHFRAYKTHRGREASKDLTLEAQSSNGVMLGGTTYDSPRKMERDAGGLDVPRPAHSPDREHRGHRDQRRYEQRSHSQQARGQQQRGHSQQGRDHQGRHHQGHMQHAGQAPPMYYEADGYHRGSR